MSTPETPSTPPPPQPGWPVYVAPRQRNGLAITAIVLSSLALALVLLVAVFAAMSSGDYDTYTLHGRVPVTHDRVPGSALESKVSDAIEDDGGSVDDVSCPETARAGAGLSVLCDATIDDVGWVALVVFDGDEGDFDLVTY